LRKLIQKVSFSLSAESLLSRFECFSIRFFIDSVREVSVPLWFIVASFDGFFDEASSNVVPGTNLVLYQFFAEEGALFFAGFGGLSTTFADELKDRCRIEGKGDELMSGVFGTLISRVANKAGLPVSALGPGVIAKGSRRDLATIFEEGEIEDECVPELVGKRLLASRVEGESSDWHCEGRLSDLFVMRGVGAKWT
jgi:hypothetical protein